MSMYRALQSRLPRALRRYVLHFEAQVERAVGAFAESVPAGGRVLDAGAGEARHARFFAGSRYIAVDTAAGDPAWDYSRLDAVADLAALPFRPESFDACLNVVTLEHLREPLRALEEMRRALKPGGRLLLAAPQEWEVHQAPHDYFRYTGYGLRYLLEQAGFVQIEIRPVGGYFRLIARRLLNGLQFFPGIWFLAALVCLAPLALVLPLLDGLDRQRAHTLGYVCTAQKARRP
jgi:SAM-dependent methyltransferase